MTAKKQYLEAMITAQAELKARPGDVTSAELEAMTALLEDYKADGWAWKDRLRTILAGLTCGCLSMFGAIPGFGVVLALAVRSVKTMITFRGGSFDITLALQLAAALIFVGLVCWGAVAVDAWQTRGSEVGDRYSALRDALQLLRGWALKDAAALAKRTGKSKQLYDHVTSQGIALRGYHLAALQTLAKKDECECDDDDYPGGGVFDVVTSLVGLGLVIALVAFSTYHALWPKAL